jgi:hypothetical protein
VRIHACARPAAQRSPAREHAREYSSAGLRDDITWRRRAACFIAAHAAQMVRARRRRAGFDLM